ncbi:unnamed protein product [Schistosoma turkestanicum]|nr:unnamed protein product [Schistosoma turkestanicum]
MNWSPANNSLYNHSLPGAQVRLDIKHNLPSSSPTLTSSEKTHEENYQEHQVNPNHYIYA